MRSRCSARATSSRCTGGQPVQLRAQLASRAPRTCLSSASGRRARAATASRCSSARRDGGAPAGSSASRAPSTTARGDRRAPGRAARRAAARSRAARSRGGLPGQRVGPAGDRRDPLLGGTHREPGLHLVLPGAAAHRPRAGPGPRWSAPPPSGVSSATAAAPPARPAPPGPFPGRPRRVDRPRPSRVGLRLRGRGPPRPARPAGGQPRCGDAPPPACAVGGVLHRLAWRRPPRRGLGELLAQLGAPVRSAVSRSGAGLLHGRLHLDEDGRLGRTRPAAAWRPDQSPSGVTAAQLRVVGDQLGGGGRGRRRRTTSTQRPVHGGPQCGGALDQVGRPRGRHPAAAGAARRRGRSCLVRRGCRPAGRPGRRRRLQQPHRLDRVVHAADRDRVGEPAERGGERRLVARASTVSSPARLPSRPGTGRRAASSAPAPSLRRSPRASASSRAFQVGGVLLGGRARRRPAGPRRAACARSCDGHRLVVPGVQLRRCPASASADCSADRVQLGLGLLGARPRPRRARRRAGRSPPRRLAARARAEFDLAAQPGQALPPVGDRPWPRRPAPARRRRAARSSSARCSTASASRIWSSVQRRRAAPPPARGPARPRAPAASGSRPRRSSSPAALRCRSRSRASCSTDADRSASAESRYQVSWAAASSGGVLGERRLQLASAAAGPRPCSRLDLLAPLAQRRLVGDLLARSVARRVTQVVGEQPQPGVAQVGLDDGGPAGHLGLPAQRLELAAQLGGEVRERG